jgi:hypothetical protein
VPAVANLQESDAVRALQDAGLRPNPVPQTSNTVPKGRVIATDPKDGTEVEKGSSVTVFVSNGPTAPVDLVAAARNATWSSGTGQLQFGDTSAPANGFVRDVTPVSGPGILETQPNQPPDGTPGFIQGNYRLPAAIIPGDRFTGQVEFLTTDANGNVVKASTDQSFVVFNLLVVNAQGQERLVEKKVDSRSDNVFDVDLTRFAGSERIILRVETVGPPVPDSSVLWINPTVKGP